MSQKSVPELISAGYEEDSSSDHSESTVTDANDDDLADGSDEEDLMVDLEGKGQLELSDEESSSDSDAISFVPSGKIEDVNILAQREVFRQQMLERINALRMKRKAAPLGPDGQVIAEEAPYSKRRASLEKKRAASGETMSRREKKNLKKRQRKEEALKSLRKSSSASDYGSTRSRDDDDDEHMPRAKRPKLVEEDLDFGQVRFDDGHAKSHYEKKKEKRDSKEKQLAKLLREREYEQKLQGTEQGERLKEDKAWTKSFKRVEGEKVKDRVDLLKKTIKREEAATRKSKKEWAERKSSLKATQEARAKKRAENIKQRMEAHKLKRMGKKSKK